jgi:hypothetical protein
MVVTAACPAINDRLPGPFAQSGTRFQQNRELSSVKAKDLLLLVSWSLANKKPPKTDLQLFEYKKLEIQFWAASLISAARETVAPASNACQLLLRELSGIREHGTVGQCQHVLQR